ncbi:hypothetical protein BdWA1_002193 [Babesia duncani]|uniref:Uncharacterized protein n=1 Tax=Babesia duncani TaxID=323732 RepID=A0AAD9PI66_9APIC|nr:hypothetical protein BdWA1_003642 [Babesia duncani]KAK2196944.1 hypothetical protein BdWA1_002193 [Babesia duncani]
MDFKLLFTFAFFALHPNVAMSTADMDETFYGFLLSTINFLKTIHNPNLAHAIMSHLKEQTTVKSTAEVDDSIEGDEKLVESEESLAYPTLFMYFKIALRMEMKSKEIVIKRVERELYEAIKDWTTLNVEQENSIIQLFIDEKEGLLISKTFPPLISSPFHFLAVQDIDLFNAFVRDFKMDMDKGVAKGAKFLKDLASIELLKKHPKVSRAAIGFIDQYFSFLGYFDNLFKKRRKDLIYMKASSSLSD